MIYLAVLFWVFAAVITVKLDAAISMRPTDYKRGFMLSLIFWPIVGGLLLSTKHEICPEHNSSF